MWPAERDIQRLIHETPWYGSVHRPCDQPFDQKQNGICWLTAAIYMLSERKFDAILRDDVKQSLIIMAQSLDSGLCPVIPENIKAYGVKLRVHKLGRAVAFKRKSKTFVSNAPQKLIRMLPPGADKIVNALVHPGSQFDFRRMAQMSVPQNVTFGDVQEVYAELERWHEPDFPIRTSVKMPDGTYTDFTIRREEEGFVLSLSKKEERQRANSKIRKSNPVADDHLPRRLSEGEKKPIVVDDDDDPYPPEGTEFLILYPRQDPIWTIKAKIGPYVYSDLVKDAVNVLHPEQRRDLMDSFDSAPFIKAVLMASGFKRFDKFEASDDVEHEIVEVTHPRARRYTVLEEIIRNYTQEHNEDFSVDRMSSDGSVIVGMSDVLRCIHEDRHAKEMLRIGMSIDSYMEFGDLIVARNVGADIVLAKNFYDVEDVQHFVTPDIAKYFLGGIVGVTVVQKDGPYKSKGGHAMMIRWCDDVGPGELKICNSWGESSCMAFDERLRHETRAMQQKEHNFYSFMKEQHAFVNKHSTTCYFHLQEAPSVVWKMVKNGTVWSR
jgi:hypothetical protein